MIIVGRHINGITINPLEFILDDNGDEMKWKDEATAKEWLVAHGVTEEEMYYLTFLNIK